MEFKDRLKQLRTESKMTQQELAEKLGMGYSRTTISAWEVGRNEPSNSDTIKIANFFDVPVDYLIGRNNVRNYKDEFYSLYKEDIKDLTGDEIKLALECFKKMKKRR